MLSLSCGCFVANDPCPKALIPPRESPKSQAVAQHSDWQIQWCRTTNDVDESCVYAMVMHCNADSREEKSANEQ